MRTPLRALAMLGIGAALGVLLSFGQGVLAKKDAGSLPIEDLRTFTEVFVKIKSDYVEAIDDRTLLANAIKGMLAGLDPHSAYLEPEDYADLQTGTRGEFGGLGIEVGMEDGFVRVIAPIDDTPADRAGIQAGDLVVRLDDTPVKGMNLEEAVKIMRGEPGTAITLTVVRQGEEGPLKITIVRDVIRVTSVKSRLLEEKYAYVRITQFQSRTGENLRDAVEELEDEVQGGIRGMILDLRSNPGGVLSAAVSVSDAFLTGGTIVYTEGRLDDAKLKFSAKPTDILDGAPLVVLVDGGSASASEIVAGALQDHRRAVIMGNDTFGKGSVQTILPMENGSALKLTTSRYFTPSGRSIQASGIKPDIQLESLGVASLDTERRRVKESDLAGHLEGEEGAPGDDPASDAGTTAPERSLAEEDFGLYEALNLLKGLDILGAAGV